MTSKEVDLIQKIGVSAYAIYHFVKEYPRSTNTDIIVNLNISMPTIRKAMQGLESSAVLKRTVTTGNTREVIVNPEQNWLL